jgi:hypothetical protein
MRVGSAGLVRKYGSHDVPYEGFGDAGRQSVRAGVFANAASGDLVDNYHVANLYRKVQLGAPCMIV